MDRGGVQIPVSANTDMISDCTNILLFNFNKVSFQLRPAGGDLGVDRPQKYFLTVCVSLSELGPSEPH